MEEQQNEFDFPFDFQIEILKVIKRPKGEGIKLIEPSEMR